MAKFALLWVNVKTMVKKPKRHAPTFKGEDGESYFLCYQVVQNDGEFVDLRVVTAAHGDPDRAIPRKR